MSYPRMAITGKMHSGKGELAQRLVDRGFVKLALADDIKAATVELVNAFELFLDPDGIPTFDLATLARDKELFRWLLQGVGTQLGRQYFGPDTIWIDRLVQKANACPAPVVVDDVRFLNEARILNEHGFLIVKIVREEAQRLASVRGALKAAADRQKRGNTGIESFLDSQNDLEKAVEAIGNHESEQEVDLIMPHLTVQNTRLDLLDQIADRLTRSLLLTTEVGG